MNSQLDQALAATLTKATATVGDGINFLKVQLPDIAQQVLSWKLASGCITIALCVAGMIGFIVYVKWAHKIIKEDDDWIDVLVPMGIICGIGSCFALIVMLVKIFVLVQILYAPKIFLVEYAASLIQ